MENTNVQKRDKKGLVILVLLLVAIVSTTFAVTFSRYMSSSTATTEATVARWEIKIGKNNGTLTPMSTGSIALDDCTWTNASTNVIDNTIAPGSVCTYELAINNNSQVDATVSVMADDIRDSNGPIANSPITATLVGVTGPLEIAAGDTEIVTLSITWPLDSNADDVDTDLGEAADDLVIDILVDAEQSVN